MPETSLETAVQTSEITMEQQSLTSQFVQDFADELIEENNSLEDEE